MIIRIAAAAIALTALGAGAFAFAPDGQVGQVNAPNSITEIQKNQVWPIKGNITMDPCAHIACQEV